MIKAFLKWFGGLFGYDLRECPVNHRGTHTYNLHITRGVPVCIWCGKRKESD